MRNSRRVVVEATFSDLRRRLSVALKVLRAMDASESSRMNGLRRSRVCSVDSSGKLTIVVVRRTVRSVPIGIVGVWRRMKRMRGRRKGIISLWVLYFLWSICRRVRARDLLGIRPLRIPRIARPCSLARVVRWVGGVLGNWHRLRAGRRCSVCLRWRSQARRRKRHIRRRWPSRRSVLSARSGMRWKRPVRCCGSATGPRARRMLPARRRRLATTRRCRLATTRRRRLATL